MSFILDALKKSESDRQQQNAPDVSGVPTGTVKAAVPRWLWGLIGLLLVNLIVLTVVLVKPTVDLQPAAAAPSEPVIRPQTPVASDIPGIPQTAENTGKQLLAKPENTATPAIITEPAAVEPRPLLQPSVPAETAVQVTFNDLRASGNLSVPDLNIDIHVYSEQPADRFVFINMNQYRENETLVEGPLLREITTEGAILEFAGEVFLLPRD